MQVQVQIQGAVFRNVKVLKLSRRLGEAGVLALFQLWEYVAEFKPKGSLDAMTSADVEIAVQWDGEPGLLFQTLLELGLLDQDGETFSVHDWKDHNPFLVTGDGKRAKQPVDFRLAVGFSRHPKIIKLRKTLGDQGVVAWLRLLAFTCEERPAGVLDMEQEDIAIAAGWTEAADRFVDSLIALKLIDGNRVTLGDPADDDHFMDIVERPYTVHNWKTRQPYRSTFPERSAKSKKANEAKWKARA